MYRRYASITDLGFVTFSKVMLKLIMQAIDCTKIKIWRLEIYFVIQIIILKTNPNIYHQPKISIIKKCSFTAKINLVSRFILKKFSQRQKFHVVQISFNLGTHPPMLCKFPGPGYCETFCQSFIWNFSHHCNIAVNLASVAQIWTKVMGV